jgi:hypothetical protein
MGYVDDAKQVPALARSLHIKYEDFELMRRKDRKVYLTLGKIKKRLFDKLQKENKTYNFSCSRGKGYEKRFGLNSDFNMVGGDKIYLATEAQYLSVVSSIKAEKKRIAELEIKRQVEAQLYALQLSEIAKNEKDERDKLAAKEKVKQAEVKRQKDLAAAQPKNDIQIVIEGESGKKNKLNMLSKKNKALTGWRCAHLSDRLLFVMNSQGAITEYVQGSGIKPETNYKYSGDTMASSLYLNWAWSVRNWGIRLAEDNDPNFDTSSTEYTNQIDSVNEIIAKGGPWVNNDFIDCRDMWSVDEFGYSLEVE